MLYGSQAFYTILTSVRDACASALRDQGDAPNRISIVPGAIAWDGCDQCGLLALASLRNYLADQFPNDTTEPASVYGTQGSLLCADMVIQIIRCAPQPDDNSLAPPVDALEASAKQVTMDAFAVMCATLDTLTQLLAANSIDDFLIRQQLFVGPEGACVGSQLNFTVAVLR